VPFDGRDSSLWEKLDGKLVTWMEKVTDAEYLSDAAPPYS
jgi:hypothetical protein